MIRRHSRGFTLIEVLVALAIVALSVGALLGSITSSASNVIYIKDKTVAEWVALNRLTEIRTWQQMPAKGNRTGKTDMAGVRWQWESEVTELPVKGMFRVDVHVRSTGESVDDEKKPPARAQAQAEPESSAAGSDLDDVSWTTTVTGVVGTATADRRTPIAFQYAVAPQTNGPVGPNNPGTPSAPGTNVPGTPSGKPGSPTNPPVSNPGLQER